MYSDDHIKAWRRVVDFVHKNSFAKIGMQIGHAGRKASTRLQWEGGEKEQIPSKGDNWPVMAASPIPYTEKNQTPKEIDRKDMNCLIADYVAAANRAQEAGFDMLELHCAHGYLLNTFLSPKTNHREDAYGGSLENRMRFPLEVYLALRSAWPDEKPISVRISANDWIEGGFSPKDAVEVAKAFKAVGCDIMDVSSGQVVAEEEPIYGRLFQLPFSEKVRLEAEVPTICLLYTSPSPRDRG